MEKVISSSSQREFVVGVGFNAVEDIQLAGGDVLNRQFIRHRRLKDVMAKISSASDGELRKLDENGGSLLHAAASMVDGAPVVKLLLSKGLDASQRDNAGLRPINYAKSGEIVTTLLMHQ